MSNKHYHREFRQPFSWGDALVDADSRQRCA